MDKLPPVTTRATTLAVETIKHVASGREVVNPTGTLFWGQNRCDPHRERPHQPSKARIGRISESPSAFFRMNLCTRGWRFRISALFPGSFRRPRSSSFFCFSDSCPAIKPVNDTFFGFFEIFVNFFQSASRVFMVKKSVGVKRRPGCRVLNPSD